MREAREVSEREREKEERRERERERERQRERRDIEREREREGDRHMEIDEHAMHAYITTKFTPCGPEVHVWVRPK